MSSGAPSKLSTNPGIYWIWSPVHFEDMCTLFLTREEPDGHPSESAAAICKTYVSMDDIPDVEDANRGEEEMRSASHRIQWKSGTRWPEGARFDLTGHDGAVRHMELEPTGVRFLMMGIGYQHPEWKHAMWRDELDVGYESWVLDEVDPEDFCTIHAHTVVRATIGDKVGIGILETLCYGAHEPSGFESFFDGAP